MRSCCHFLQKKQRQCFWSRDTGQEIRGGSGNEAFISYAYHASGGHVSDPAAGDGELQKGIIYEFDGRKLYMENKIMTEVNEKKVSGSSFDNRGMGTVEMILIIVVLIGLVLIFKTQIMELTESIFQKIAADSSAILA